MIEVTRRFEWDSGHRVLGHEGKCKFLHGHRYRADVTFTAPGLDSLDRTVDFGAIKHVVGRWIDDHWDHRLLLNNEDPLKQVFENHLQLFGQRPYFMSGNPTAEVMVQHLAEAIHTLPTLAEWDQVVVLTRIRLYETPNCWADWRK